MRSLTEAAQKHRDSAVREVRTAFAQCGFEPADPRTTQRLAEALFDGLLERVRVTDDGALLDCLVAESERGIPLNALVSALQRMGGALRLVAFRDLRNKKMTLIASGAIDRAVAETCEEFLAGSEARHEGPSELAGMPTMETKAASVPAFNEVTAIEELPTQAAPPPPEPTIIRNINELLRQGDGSGQVATVLSIAYATDIVTEHDALEAVTRVSALPLFSPEALAARDETIERAGAYMLFNTPALLSVALPALVDRGDIEEAMGLARALVDPCTDRACCAGVARGTLWPATEKNGSTLQAFGQVLTTSVALTQSARPGEIACTPTVHSAIGSVYIMREAASTPAAFILAPSSPQWVDRWEQAALVREPALQGNHHALRELQAALRSSAHKVSVIALKGRAGAGKWHLLTTALEQMKVPDSRLLVGRPYPRVAAPFWPLIEIIRQVLSLHEATQQIESLEASLRELASSSASTTRLMGLLPTLAILLGVDNRSESDALADDREPSPLWADVANTLSVLLEAAADRQPDQPLVVALKEMQEMDDPTRRALTHILQTYEGAAQLVFVLTHRGQFKEPTDTPNAGFTRVSVDRLPADDLVAIGGEMLDSPTIPSRLEELLRERSDGLPMMAVTLIRYCVENGLLARVEGRWEFNESSRDAPIPRRLTELLGHRMLALPVHLVSLLKSASTLGERLPRLLLEALQADPNVSAQTLDRSLSLLVELGYLRRLPDGDLRFAHPLIRDVAYGLQGDDARRQSHRNVSRAYRSCVPDAMSRLPVILFHHDREAGEISDMRRAGVAAAQHAMVLQDISHGIDVASSTLTLCDDWDGHRETRFDLLSLRERMHEALGMREAQLKDLSELQALGEAFGGPRLGKTLHRRARLGLLAAGSDAVIDIAERAVDMLATGDPLDLSNALRTLALIRWKARDAAGAAEALQRALDIYEKLGHARGMGFVLHNLGMFSLDSGAIDTARDYLGRALTIKESTDDERGRAAILDALGRIDLLEGNIAAATNFFELAVQTHQGAGNNVGAAHSEVSLGELLLTTEPARAEALAAQALLTIKNTALTRTQAEANMLLSQARLAQGKKKASERPAKKASDLCETLASPLLKLRSELTLAEVSLAYKGPKRAERAMLHADAAARLALEAGAMRWRIEALVTLARSWARIDAQEAQRHAREALAMLNDRTYAGLDAAGVTRQCDAILAESPLQDVAKTS